MSTRITTALALLAGLIGGALSHYLFEPMPVRAQATVPVSPEIRAQKFVLVDENGTPRGAFGIRTKDDWATLEVTDKSGHVWQATLHDAAGFLGKGKPSVVPVN